MYDLRHSFCVSKLSCLSVRDEVDVIQSTNAGSTGSGKNLTKLPGW